MIVLRTTVATIDVTPYTSTRFPSEATYARSRCSRLFTCSIIVRDLSADRLKNASGVKASKRGTNLAHTTRRPRLSLPSIITHSLTYYSLTETHSVTHQSELTFTSNLCVDSTDPFLLFIPWQTSAATSHEGTQAHCPAWETACRALTPRIHTPGTLQPRRGRRRLRRRLGRRRRRRRLSRYR
jgi:hypothetical protein